MSIRHKAWDLNGARYTVEIHPQGGGGKWGYSLTETFPNKQAWSRNEGGYQSEVGARKAAASAYKKRAGLKNSLTHVLATIFSA